MKNILISKMVEKGYRADQTSKIIAKVIGCSERTVRNKIKGLSEFTITEGMKINKELFDNKFDLGYLFSQTNEKLMDSMGKTHQSA